jgi:hypothetical protein
MATTTNDNFRIEAGKHVDDRYTKLGVPYADAAEVNATIVISRRYKGLTVLIVDQEYWYRDGITDTDLILKTTGESTGNTFQNGLTETAGVVEWGGQVSKAGGTFLNLMPPGVDAATAIIIRNDPTDAGATNNAGLSLQLYDDAGVRKSVISLLAANKLVPGEFLGLVVDIHGGNGDPGMIVHDSRAVPKGFEYAANYSATYGPRSLIDKGYLDSRIDEIVTGGVPVDEGISKEGGTIKLGSATFPTPNPITSSRMIQVTAPGSLLFMDGAGNTMLAFLPHATNGNTVALYSAKATTSEVMGFTLGFPGGAIFSDGRTVKKGIEYAANYSATFTARSLVDKGYVDGALAGVSVTVGDGLMNDAGVIKIGNPDSGAADPINGFRYIKIADSSVLTIVDFQENTIASFRDAGLICSVTLQSYNNDTSEAIGFQLNLTNADAALFTDNRTLKRGIEYSFSDYTNLQARSLVTKEWVTAAIAAGGSGIATANNGLTVTASNVQLGGALTKTTLINGGASWAFNVTNVAGMTLSTAAGNLSLSSAAAVTISATAAGGDFTVNVNDVVSITAGGTFNLAITGNILLGGVAPSSPSTMFFRGDKTWAVPGGGGGGPAHLRFRFNSSLYTEDEHLFKGPVTTLTATKSFNISSFTFEVKLDDGSSSYLACSDVAAVLAWVAVNVTVPTTMYWIKCLATYGSGVGTGEVFFTYT